MLSIPCKISDKQPMKILKILLVLTPYLLVACFSIQKAHASTFSVTGVLSSPTDPNEYTLTLPTSEDVTLQTFGFGGGTNAASMVIAPGGTDPLVAIFSGTGDSAVILTEGTVTFGTSLSEGNYGSFAGCPPANAPTFGTDTECGDVEMTISGLGAGTYTIVLGDGAYVPNAFTSNGTLGEGFTDFTGGQFCNVNIDGISCTGAFALDVITSGSSTFSAVPEPGSLLVIGIGAAWLFSRRRQFVS
ncbi:MAG TPA: DVUA0089 family protein [Terriglobia bacterium]